MEPVVLGSIIGGSAMLGGAGMGLIGSKKQSKEMQRMFQMEMEMRQKAVDELQKVGIPPIEAQRIALETPELVYNYVPNLEKDFAEIKSKYADIEVDPRLAEAQMSALDEMQQRAEGGLTEADRAQMNMFRRQMAGEAKAQDASILQNMEQRGLGGSGSELIQRLMSGQTQQMRAADEADKLALANYEAQQKAIMDAQNMASNIRTQSFSEQAQQAGAEDAMAQFNRQNMIGTQQRNVGARNIAAQTKEGLRQDISTAGTSTRNVQETSNKELIGQDYQNRLAKAQSIANAYTGAGSAIGAQMQNMGAAAGGKYNALASALGGIGQFAAGAGAKISDSMNRGSGSMGSSGVDNSNQIGFGGNQYYIQDTSWGNKYK